MGTVPTHRPMVHIPSSHSFTSLPSGAQDSHLPASTPEHFLGPGGIMVPSPDPSEANPAQPGGGRGFCVSLAPLLEPDGISGM